MPSSRKKIPYKTRRIQDILSLNQCAYPECTNTLVEPGVGKSGSTVTGEVCHIHAVSPGGARWKAGLTKEELNSPANLIFLCKHHHGIVDGQSEYYTAEMLKEWKQKHEARETENLSVGMNFVRALVDEKIKDETDKLRKSHFYDEFDQVGESLTLARKLTVEEFSIVGSDVIRCQALAWCVRILASECQDKAEEYLTNAKDLGTGPETTIAEAFLLAQKGEKPAALAALAEIDTPMSRSAALIIVARCESRQEAIDWLKTARIDPRGLDPDGKRALLAYQLALADWMAAHEFVGILTEDDLQANPVLHHLVAITHLLTTVPVELRPAVLQQPPFNTANFRLAADETAIKARREAHHHFNKAQEVADQLNLHRAATIAEEYSLWLELTDPRESDKGRNRLKSVFRNLETGLRFVRFGVQHGIKLDLEAIEREIERQTALNGEITPDAAHARFALVFTKKAPEDVANYIARYRNELVGHIDSKFVMSIQIEALSQAGQFENANEVLNLLIKEGLPEIEVNRHRQMLIEAAGNDPVVGQKELFEQTDSLSDLANLVDDLVKSNAWDDLCVYGATLFERTKDRRDLETYALALHSTQKNERLVEILESHKTFLSQSRKLQLLYCFSLYNEGMLLKACTEVEALSADWDDQNYRELRMNLGISMGDWNSLSEIVANGCTNKKKRSAIELIRIAHLAICLDSPQVQVRELILEAVSKGNDDPKVYAAAYYLATKTGWDNEEVAHWLHQAARLSGGDGPLWKMTLKDVLERQPEWNRQQTEIRQKLLRGEMPIYLAGQYLNKSLVDLMLYPSLTNPTTADPRHRSAVLAYSEKRQPSSLNTDGQVGVDATSLITLGYLNLLDETLDAFDTVHIPHSTMHWLFEEKENAGFHQPSRIDDAHRISELIAGDELLRLSPTAVPDSDLSDQIGIELAQFIAEAEKGKEEADSQHIVIRSYPVHRLASLMEEEVDLNDKWSVLSSCHSIVDYMQERGRFTTQEEKKACDYLQLQERPWPNEPKIEIGAVLYLDELAVGHLLHLGILEKLKANGLRPVISQSVISEVVQLINYEKVSDGIAEVVEHIRSSISSRLESGKITAGRRIRADQLVDPSVIEHPTLGVFFLSEHCNAIITDDRYLNQHPGIEVNGKNTPSFTTLDLLDALVSSNKITAEDRWHHRTRLRQGGYLFVPVDVEELIQHLDNALVKNGAVVETAELKAIRENLLLVRLSGSNLSVEEDDWFRSLSRSFSSALSELWRRGDDNSIAQARSDWILSQLDIRSWAHCFDEETGKHMASKGYVAHIVSLLLLPFAESLDVKEAYWKWIEDRVLTPTKEQNPEMYLELVEWYKNHIASMVDRYAVEGMGNE